LYVFEEEYEMVRPRVLLADSHPLLMDAFRKLLEPEFEVVATVSDGQTLLTAALQLNPDLIVVDLGLPWLYDMDTGRMLKKLLPKTRILVVTMNEDVGVVVEALREWAVGFLLKKSTGTEVLYAIRELLAAGNSHFTPRAYRRMERAFLDNPDDDGQKSLTPRQREVLQLLAEGLTMKETADTLKLTARTIAFHKYKIMQDFRLHNNSDLLKLAIREHLV
jgi:DNA-binding NarL/FixJ family response regulator